MIRSSVFLALCLASSVAVADCHIRSNIKLNRQAVEFGPTDVQRMVVPESGVQRCTVQYRVNINDTWTTAEGVGMGATEDEACDLALDVGRGNVLLEAEPKRVTTDTQMVCTDFEEIRVRTVRIGDVVWESETDIHVVPDERRYFQYKFTTCRMFTERNVKNRNWYTYQGVICRADSTKNSKWRVVDKY